VATLEHAVPEVQVQGWMLRRRAADERRAAEDSSVTKRAAYAALALLVGTAVVALLLYAAGPDDYYRGGNVSRWEHARGYDGWIWFVASIVLGVVSFAGLVARALGLAARLNAAVLGLTLFTFLSFPVAWVAVTAGH
jgi:hypothetical protein